MTGVPFRSSPAQRSWDGPRRRVGGGGGGLSFDTTVESFEDGNGLSQYDSNPSGLSVSTDSFATDGSNVLDWDGTSNEGITDYNDHPWPDRANNPTFRYDWKPYDNGSGGGNGGMAFFVTNETGFFSVNGGYSVYLWRDQNEAGIYELPSYSEIGSITNISITAGSKYTVEVSADANDITLKVFDSSMNKLGEKTVTDSTTSDSGGGWYCENGAAMGDYVRKA